MAKRCKLFTSNEIYEHWSTGKPIKCRGQEYAVNATTMGRGLNNYFLDPWKGGEASERKKFVKDFEYMRDMAELRALSSYSLEVPLDDCQFKRMMELKHKLGLG